MTRHARIVTAAAASTPTTKLPTQDIKVAVGKSTVAHSKDKQDVERARAAIEHIGAVLAKGTGPKAEVQYINGTPGKLASIAARYSDIRKGHEAQSFFDNLDTWFRKG